MQGAAQITQLLEEARRGDAAATDQLVPLLYAELRRMAAGLMARERGATLQPTALVHEAYLRLLGGGGAWQGRAHFLGAAARAMRRILIERARGRGRLKRGGVRERVTLTDGARQYHPRPEDMLALDAALDELQVRDPGMARVVELRYFGGLTVPETAEVLGTSDRSVHRQWAAARAWLHRALDGGASA
jgi:RNA polymerase sigma factor (TIGR02999 family)